MPVFCPLTDAVPSLSLQSSKEEVNAASQVMQEGFPSPLHEENNKIQTKTNRVWFFINLNRI
jgi:hypothetical protein